MTARPYGEVLITCPSGHPNLWKNADLPGLVRQADLVGVIKASSTSRFNLD
jgi:hypothetical protein